MNKNEEKQSFSQAVQLSVQGQWTNWCDYVQNDLSWKVIWALPPNLLAFCLGATYNTLPSPSNLKRWRIKSDDTCFLCQKEICTVAHILTGCPVSLNDGRYTFRHDSVLRKLALTLQEVISTTKLQKPRVLPYIAFVKAGGTHKKCKKTQPYGILHKSNDWEIIADLDKQLIFPPHIAITAERPDIVIFSNKLKYVIKIELTCPCEENFQRAQIHKINKYANLRELICHNGWSSDLFTVEVGARGYCSNSVTTTLKKLGTKPKTARKVSKELGIISMKCSYSIWLARNSKQWNLKENSLQVKEIPQSLTKCYRDHPSHSKIKPHNSTTNKPSILTVEPYHVGLANLGNTCYANALLQALYSIPKLWLNNTSSTLQQSTFLKSFFLTMGLLNNSKTSFSPKFFINSLSNTMQKSTGQPFNPNEEQDVPEVLAVVLCEIVGNSISSI